MPFKKLACALGIISLLLAGGNARAQTAPPEKAPGADKLPSVIPIFPLEEAMLFPGVSRPLYIFEPRYRAMVADALKGDRIIGMTTLKPGYEANYEGRPPVYAIGCAGVITDVEELPDGRFNILLRGLVKFRVTSEDHSRAYRLARVEAMPETTDDKDGAALHKDRARLEALLAASVAPGAKPPPPEFPDELLVNGLAQYLAIDPSDRQDLLEREGVLSRSHALLDLLEKKVAPPR